MVDNVSKILIISMVCVASSMRSAKGSSGGAPGRHEKKVARKGGFFVCEIDD